MEFFFESQGSEATIVDVRTFAEFVSEHLQGSINIPLGEIPSRLDEFTGKQNLIVCCASGVRSRKAAELLKQNNIECRDGGSWQTLKTNITINQ
jgi:phage shock protein E